MKILAVVGLWALFILLLLGSVVLYIKANTERQEADKIYEDELKQEKQTSNLTWKYRQAKALAGLSGATYFCAYLVACNLLNLFWLTVLFIVMFLAVLCVTDVLDKKSGIDVETGTINSVAYLGYLYSLLGSLDALDNPIQLGPTYAHLTNETVIHFFSRSETPQWFLWIVTTFVLFLTVVLTLVFFSTALLHLCGAREHAGYLTARDAIHKWHRTHLNKIMHRDDFVKVSAALDTKAARNAKVRKILRTFGAGSLAGTYFYLSAVFTKANIAIGAVLTGWGLWTLMPQRQQEAVEEFISEKILKIQFQEWDSWASIIAGLMLIIGIFFAYSRVEKISPIFRSNNYEQAVKKLSELYTEYSNLLDNWSKYYKSELALHLNDVYQAYLENISEAGKAIKVAGIYKFHQRVFPSRAQADPSAEELPKILGAIDQKFEGLRNKTEAAVVSKFLLKHNLLLGYLDQYRFINGYSKFSENFELPGDTQQKVASEADRFVNIFSDPSQQEEEIRTETRLFIIQTELDILMTYLRIREIQRTVDVIRNMHRKSVKEKIAEAIRGK